MILDAQNQFSDEQTVTQAAAAIGTNTISLGADRSIGAGEPMGVLFTIDTTALVSDNDEDYTFDVEYSSDVGQTTARKLVGRAIFESGTPDAPALDADLLAAGFQFVIPIMPSKKDLSELFLGIRCTAIGTTASVTFTAHLMPLSMLQNDEVYADAITIS